MSNQSPLVNFSIRGFQIIFAIVVLAVSISLVKGQAHYESITRPPVLLRYAVFAGAITLFASIVGIASQWVKALEGKVILLIDITIGVVNLIGGILLAVGVGASKCTDSSSENLLLLGENGLFNGGCIKHGECYNLNLKERWKFLLSRCVECQVDSVFMFLSAVLLLVSPTLTYLRMRKGY